MAQLNSPTDMLEYWRALSGDSDSDGWRTIPLDVSGNCSLRAGRYYPDDTEAILIGFRSVIVPANKHLPQGQGFRVEKINSSVTSGKQVWIALSRLSGGSMDMFAIMVQDIVQTVHNHANDSENSIFQTFLGRIRAWQSFMDKASLTILNIQEEIGLFGELIVLENLLRAGLMPDVAVNTWMGPLDCVHDFLLSNGGIEVKSTVADHSFVAKISSLEQLDNTLVYPLFLAGIRLAISDSGLTLPDFIQEIRHYFDSDLGAMNIYDCRLIQAGFLTAFSDRYTRQFRHVSSDFYEVSEGFPRLTSNNIPLEIINASYDLNVALIKDTPLRFDDVIEKLRGK